MWCDVMWFCDMEWCMMRCGAMWNEMGCVTMLPHHALPHHTSIIQHLSAQHSTSHHISSCNTVHTMLCHIAPPCTAHHVRCGVLCHVFCDMEWVCGMWCGAMWNVIQCHHTMLCHSAPPHIAQHSRIAQHHISLHNIPHLFTLHSTDHALPHRTTTYCTSCDVMRCVMCHVIWNGA